MTVSSTISREQYATDGVSAVFTIHFPFFDDTDVNAVFVNASGVASTLTLATDFTVAGGGGAGGTLTTTGTASPLAAGGALTIYRDIPYTQEDDYVENDPLPADTLESGLDRAAMRDQQLLDAVGRAVSLPVTIDPSVSAVLPNPSPLLFLRWNATGNALELVSIAATGATSAASISETRQGSNTADFVTSDALASLWQKGADIASAATLVKPTDTNLGGYHVITGTTAVSAMWTGTTPGEEYEFETAAALPLTHGTNFQLITSANVTCAAGDRFRMRYFGSNVWKMVGFQRGNGSPLTAAIGFHANKNGANQTAIATGVDTKVTFTNEVFDLGGCFDAPNSRFVAPLSGLYMFSASLFFGTGVVDQNGFGVYFFKNGAAWVTPFDEASGSSAACPNSTCVMSLTAGDIVEIYAHGDGTGNKTVSGGNAFTWFMGGKIG